MWTGDENTVLALPLSRFAFQIQLEFSLCLLLLTEKLVFLEQGHSRAVVSVQRSLHVPNAGGAGLQDALERGDFCRIFNDMWSPTCYALKYSDATLWFLQ